MHLKYSFIVPVPDADWFIAERKKKKKKRNITLSQIHRPWTYHVLAVIVVNLQQMTQMLFYKQSMGVYYALNEN